METLSKGTNEMITYTNKQVRDTLHDYNNFSLTNYLNSQNALEITLAIKSIELFPKRIKQMMKIPN